MYFWKYWRDTRRGVYIYLGLLVFFALIWLIGMYHANRIGRISADRGQLWGMTVGAAFGISFLCALIMGFATGSNSVGSDVSKGTADFLITRARPRRYFVWAGWTAGIAEIFALIVITSILVAFFSTLAMGAAWRHLPSATHVQAGNENVDVWLMLATVLTTAAVIFGLTYFLSILLRSGQRGVLAALAVVFVYSAAKGLLKQWLGISIPSLNFTENPGGIVAWYLKPSVEIILWAIIALAFPLASQIVFERFDV